MPTEYGLQPICVLRVMTQFAVEACASLVKEDDVPGGKVAHQCTLQVCHEFSIRFAHNWFLIIAQQINECNIRMMIGFFLKSRFCIEWYVKSHYFPLQVFTNV